MLRSFLIITFRILWRNKVTSFINIFSLTIGITAFILIMLYVDHELSYDKFHEHYDRIYRLESGTYGQFPPVVFEYIRDRVSGIENMTRLAIYSTRFVNYLPDENPEDLRSVEIRYFFADSTIFDVFTLPFVKGSPETALRGPYTAVLTETTARKLFGDREPMGEEIQWGAYNFRITGIIRDVARSHLEVEAIFSFQSLEDAYPGLDPNQIQFMWDASYLLLDQQVDPEQVQSWINKVLAELNDGTLLSIQFEPFILRPLKDVYLTGSKATGFFVFGRYGNLRMVRIFIAAAACVLVLACVNYINLTTARAALRSMEVAIKKIAGSPKYLLGYQFIAESILITLISYVLALTTIQVLIPWFNTTAMTNIQMAAVSTPFFWIISFVGVLALGILSGVYPALYLTSVRSTHLIGGGAVKGSRRALFRKVLMAFQFVICTVLIIGILANLRQMSYARNYDLGFDKEHIIRIRTPARIEKRRNDFTTVQAEPAKAQVYKNTFRERLVTNPRILKASFVSNVEPTNTFEIDGKNYTAKYIFVDPDYLDLMGIELLEGRNFSRDRAADWFDWRAPSKIVPILINETAANNFYRESPFDRIITFREPNGLDSYRAKVIGIVRDFNVQSIHHEIPPMIIYCSGAMYLTIKISPTDIPATIAVIEQEWRNVYGTMPLSYSFMDEAFDRQYQRDEQASRIIGYFTLLAIAIACMGLFALSSFLVVRRTKEIGIRKAMGASSWRIALMLSREFVLLVLIAVLIASPIAWFLTNNWLQSFAYRIELGADIFVLAALIVLFISLATIALQSLRAAGANPVEALRYE